MRIKPLTRHMKNRVHEHGDEVEIVQVADDNEFLLQHKDNYLGWRTLHVDFEVINESGDLHS